MEGRLFGVKSQGSLMTLKLSLVGAITGTGGVLQVRTEEAKLYKA